MLWLHEERRRSQMDGRCCCVLSAKIGSQNAAQAPADARTHKRTLAPAPLALHSSLGGVPPSISISISISTSIPPLCADRPTEPIHLRLRLRLRLRHRHRLRRRVRRCRFAWLSLTSHLMAVACPQKQPAVESQRASFSHFDCADLISSHLLQPLSRRFAQCQPMQQQRD